MKLLDLLNLATDKGYTRVLAVGESRDVTISKFMENHAYGLSVDQNEYDFTEMYPDEALAACATFPLQGEAICAYYFFTDLGTEIEDFTKAQFLPLRFTEIAQFISRTNKPKSERNMTVNLSMIRVYAEAEQRGFTHVIADSGLPVRLDHALNIFQGVYSKDESEYALHQDGSVYRMRDNGIPDEERVLKFTTVYSGDHPFDNVRQIFSRARANGYTHVKIGDQFVTPISIYVAKNREIMNIDPHFYQLFSGGRVYVFNANKEPIEVAEEMHFIKMQEEHERLSINRAIQGPSRKEILKEIAFDGQFRDSEPWMYEMSVDLIQVWGQPNQPKWLQRKDEIDEAIRNAIADAIRPFLHPPEPTYLDVRNRSTKTVRDDVT